MSKRSAQATRLAIALFFLAIVCLINFTHIEKGPASDINCPACWFQQTALGFVSAAFVFLPLLVLFIFIEALRCRDYQSLFIRPVTSRSPPSA